MRNEQLGIDIHADDYALSVNNSKRILELLADGKLDSISVIPNSSSFSECMDMLAERWESLGKKPLISVHLNIADGFSLSGIDDPSLTARCGDRTVFRTSWAKLLISSYLPGRRGALRDLLKKEFAAQIEAVCRALPGNSDSVDASPAAGDTQKAADNPDPQSALRLDSHTHTHMIPVVFDSMMDAVKELGMQDRLEFVRVSAEPVKPFIKVAGTISPVNLIKNLLLGALSGRARRKLRSAGVTYGLLWGVMMSGKMDAERVEKLLSRMKGIAQKRGEKLEVLFHPGKVTENEDHPEFSAGDDAFVRSENRDVEYLAVTSVRL